MIVLKQYSFFILLFAQIKGKRKVGSKKKYDAKL